MEIRKLKEKVVIECRNCGTRCETSTWIPGNTDKCPSCGGTLYLEDAGRRFKKKCPFCGEKVAIDAIKCPYCQSALDENNLMKHAAPFIDTLFAGNQSPSSISSAIEGIVKWLGPDEGQVLAGFLIVFRRAPESLAELLDTREKRETQLKELGLTPFIECCGNVKKWIADGYLLVEVGNDS